MSGCLPGLLSFPVSVETVFAVTEHLLDSQLASNSPGSLKSQVSDPSSKNHIRLVCSISM